MSRPLIMSFRLEAAAMCLSGLKRQTRRILKDPSQCWVSDGRIGNGPTRATISEIAERDGVFYGRPLWRVGDTVAIKPSRTAKAIGRVLVTALRVQHVQEITEEDARQEGLTPSAENGNPVWGFGEAWYSTAQKAYRAIWDRLYPSGPRSWDANPLVVAITFEPEPPTGGEGSK